MNRLNWNSQTAEGVCVTFFSKYVSFSICLCVKKHEKPFFLKYLENEWTDWAEIHTHYPRWSERCNKQCKKITFVCLFVRCLSVKTHKKTFLQIARKLKGRLSWNSFTTPMLVKGVTSVTFFVQMWHFVYLFAHKKQWQIIFFKYLENSWTDWAEIYTQYQYWSEVCLGHFCPESVYLTTEGGDTQVEGSKALLRRYPKASIINCYANNMKNVFFNYSLFKRKLKI